MIQAIPCPGCHRTLILAADASLQAVLKCRHCSHQFVLGEMIEKELGFWEVVDDPQAPEPSSAPNSAGIQASESAVEDADLELAEESEYVSPQSLMKKQTTKKNVDWSKFEPITHEQFERMRRKNKSAIWSTLSVLLGGLASLPIATLLIWHVLGKDPLQMGPVVARYVPWIVPTRFRPMDDQDFARSEFTPPAGQSGFRKFDSVLNQPEPNEPSGSDPSSPSLDNSDPSSSNEPNVDNSIVSSRILRARERRAPRAFPPPLSAPPMDASLDVDQNVQESTESAPATADNVFKLIDDVEKNLTAWIDRIDDLGNKQLAQQIYGGLTSVALAVNEIPATSAIRRLVRNELRTTSKTIDEQLEIQQLIQAGSRHWLPKLQSGAPGGTALVVEVVEASERDGSWQITTTSPNPGAPNLVIVAPLEVASALSPGQRIFVLGVTEVKSASAEESPESADDVAAEISETNEVNDPNKGGSETEQPALRVNAGFIFVMSSEEN